MSAKYGKAIMIWDLTINIHAHIPANCPDITTHTKKNRHAILINVSIPSKVNVIPKMTEKVVKYRYLEIEIRKCWGLKKVRTIPIIISALRPVCTGQTKYL